MSETLIDMLKCLIVSIALFFYFFAGFKPVKTKNNKVMNNKELRWTVTKAIRDSKRG